MRKTALLTGVAGLFLMTAPAFAQDSTAPQTPAAPPAAEQPGRASVQPGQTVRGSDGAELGKLEGVRNVPGGQELTVRGADGQLRGVPTTGFSQEGSNITVGWSSSEFQAAPAIAAPPAPAGPAAPTGEPGQPTQPTTPDQPPAEPTAPPSSQPPADETPTTADEPEA